MSSVANDFGFMRLKQVLEVYPVGKTLWWKMVKEGRAPQSIKLSDGVTAWSAKDIKLFCELKAQGKEWDGSLRDCA